VSSETARRAGGDNRQVLTVAEPDEAMRMRPVSGGTANAASGNASDGAMVSAMQPDRGAPPSCERLEKRTRRSHVEKGVVNGERARARSQTAAALWTMPRCEQNQRHSAQRQSTRTCPEVVPRQPRVYRNFHSIMFQQRQYQTLV